MSDYTMSQSVTWTAASNRSAAFFLPAGATNPVLDFAGTNTADVLLERYQASVDPDQAAAVLAASYTTSWAQVRRESSTTSYVAIPNGGNTCSVLLSTGNYSSGLPQGWYRLYSTWAPVADLSYYVRFEA